MARGSRIIFGALIMVMLFPAAMFAQGTTGQLTGTVTQAGAPLPGVTITISSPNLQGTRTSTTNENGAYNFPALPPGDYTVVFALEGMQTMSRKTNVGLVTTARVDAELKMAKVAEAITVTASAPTVLETTQVETNVKQQEVNRLPIARNPVAVANLTPGVTTNGPRNATVISGAFAYDNLWLVNGAVVNENLRGQPHALYIEDAIQETTVLSGGVSAEYGRFTGGVVSAITKSGGNEFSGSLRDSLDKPSWTAESEPNQPAPPVDKINSTYEATFGGRIVRDRLWFFTAGRKQDDNAPRNLNVVKSGFTPGAYNQKNTRHRYEGKLTGQITPKHSLVLSYLNNKVSQTNNCQLGCLDYRTLAPIQTNPNDFKTAHYNGILTNSFMVEADYAKKYFAFVGSGGIGGYGSTDPAVIAENSPMIDQVVTGAAFNAPYFCGVCTPETRNNKEWEVKGHYFLGTKSLGTHNAVFGYDDWAEQRQADNYQSPTSIRFDVRTNPPVQNPDGTVSIQVHGDPAGNGDRFIYFPIAFTSKGSDLVTKSVFFNDKWDLNPHFSFNLGARYDKNDAIDSFHNKVSDDSAVSPRLGVIYDVFSNGKLRVDLNYGKYVGRLAETVASGSSAAGNPATFRYAYAGPDLPLMDSRAAALQVFQWFYANGGYNRSVISASIPGVNTKMMGTIQSPNMREITVGAGMQVGKGFFRGDYINRDWQDFYAQFTNLSTGSVLNPANNQLVDLNLIGNSSVPTRKYWAAQFQGQYQLPMNFSLGGNYTYSKLTGNVEGETGGAGPGTFTGSTVSYPEYQAFAQNAPIGFLNADQRHKVRLWLNYTLGSPIGRFNIGLIERYDSGTPYSASGSIPITSAMLSDANKNPIYPNGATRDPAHDYATRPTAVTYFFGERGAYRFDNLTATDLAINYELPVKVVGLFVKAELRNAFNQIANVGGDTTVFTANNSGRGLSAFNPFTQAPVECPQGSTAAQCTAMGANWMKGPNFGKPLSDTTFATQGSYQLPRTYLFSFGARF
ncbi:MAG TPA: carboxypeptidase regulatory-like domain-containing protein [Thermoanaerobaculia bacterium]|nr:carboxypeptidase regulatory-like domain-containing protein [Thermoanaerobaculia bacterium]